MKEKLGERMRQYDGDNRQRKRETLARGRENRLEDGMDNREWMRETNKKQWNQCGF